MITDRPRTLSRANTAVGLCAAAASLAVLGLAYFLRDPARRPPNDPRAILAPADGRVLLIAPAAAPEFVVGPAWRLMIFLSLWDVHVQRAPAAGRVALSQRQLGGFAPAFQARAAHNAGHRLGVETAYGRLLLVRTSGLVARRVTTTVAPGQALLAGERIGRILLGSRAELFIPSTAAVRIRPGQHVRAGETVLATWGESEGHSGNN